ncbi:MAG: hypothetical protein IPI49_04350 [Myxococcales bacterium]|nr:hypothetical protein [Myxococcales bacterium]
MPAAAAKPAAGAAGAAAAPGGAVPGADPSGQPVQMPQDAPPKDMEGTDENPDAPVDFDAPPPLVAAPPKRRPQGYPMEEVFRPLTLLRFQTEVGLDSRTTFSPFINGSALRVRFGVTSKVQVSLVYNVGGIYDDGRGSTTFNTGKAVGLGATVQIRPWIAAAVSVPMYLEPFAASLTVGAPMKFQFAERFALVLAEDILDVRLDTFVPSLINEAANEVQAGRVGTNTTRNKGNLRFSSAGIYQHKPNLAFIGRIAISFIDFKSIDIGYLLKAGAQYSVRKNIDVSALLGFDDLEEASETFGLTLGAQIRI